MDLDVLSETFFSAVRALVPGAVFTIDQFDVTTGVVTEQTSVGASLPGRHQEESPRTHAYASCDASIQSREKRRDAG